MLGAGVERCGLDLGCKGFGGWVLRCGFCTVWLQRVWVVGIAKFLRILGLWVFTKGLGRFWVSVRSLGRGMFGEKGSGLSVLGVLDEEVLGSGFG